MAETLAEKNARYSRESTEMMGRIGDLLTGVLKGATTDLVGAPVDIANMVLKAVGVPTVDKPIGGSKYIREAVGQNAEDASPLETIGTFINPEGAAKAMIVAAAKVGKDVERAIKLSKDKLSPATVFKETGVYKENGAAKAVISDAESSAKYLQETRKNTSLGKVLDHPELYAAYPELKNVVIVPVEGSSAKFISGGNKDLDAIHIGVDMDAATQKAAILHEVQHAVQTQEKKFMKGSSPSMEYQKDPTLSPTEAYKAYFNTPGEQEARFTEFASNKNQSAIEADVLRFLQAGGTPANPQNLVADLDRFTAPVDVQEMIVAAAKFPKRLERYEQLVEEAAKSGKVYLDKPGIFKESNVYKDRDGQLKTFVSDKLFSTSNTTVVDPVSYKLVSKPGVGDKITNPVLGDWIGRRAQVTDVYPELLSIPVKNEGALNSGSMQPDNAFMTIANQHSQDRLASVLLHETQHAIQHIEGFGKGGNTEQFLKFDPTSVQVKLDRARKSGDVSQIQAAERFAKKANEALQEATNRYMNLPGEQEARFTQKTMNMNNMELKDEIMSFLERGDTPQTWDTRPIRPIPTSK